MGRPYVALGGFSMTNQAETGSIRVATYKRVSTQEQTESGGGLAAQSIALTDAIKARGWELHRSFGDEAISGGTPWRDRFGLSEAIAYIEQGNADVLMVAKLDRLTRSVADFCSLAERAKKKGWKIVALDLGIDMTTPAGELMANVFAAFSQFERRLIGVRTKEGMAAKKAAGTFKAPVGRPSGVSADTLGQMILLRSLDWGYAYIARFLNANGYPTPQSAPTWSRATVRAVLMAQEGKE